MFLTPSRHVPSSSNMSRSNRRGFSLIELMIVCVLLAVVGAALTSAITRQQRFYRGAGEVMHTRGQMRQAIDILSAELRGVSASGGDIYAGSMGTTSIEFRSTFGRAIACRFNGLTQIYVPANQTLAAGNRLTFLGFRPLVGHGVFVFDEGATEGSSDDVWQFRTITAVADNTNPCTGTTYTGAGDATKVGLLITLDAALPATVVAGASVSFVHRVRYGLYNDASNNWYLGYCSSNTLGAACNTLQPVSGPYRAANSDATAGTSGLNFYYYDENGVATTDRLLVARIEIAVRGTSSNLASRAGEVAQKNFTDTSRVIVGLRNRR